MRPSEFTEVEMISAVLDEDTGADHFNGKFAAGQQHWGQTRKRGAVAGKHSVMRGPVLASGVT